MAGANTIDVRIRLIDEASKQMKNVGKEAKGLTKQFGDLSKVVGALGLAVVAKQMGKFAVESTMLAARVETLGVVTKTLGRTAGLSATEVTKLERAIQKQGITTQASRQALAKMMQAQLDVADASKLARLAQDAAVVANINSSEAFERLINVIASGNVRMARTMGLQVDFNAGYEKMANQLGITTDALTAGQKAQARANAVMEEGAQIAGAYADAMDTAGKQVLSTARYWEEYKVAVGDQGIPVMKEVNSLVQEELSRATERQVARNRLTEAERLGLITREQSLEIQQQMALNQLDWGATLEWLQGIVDDHKAAIEALSWAQAELADKTIQASNATSGANPVIKSATTAMWGYYNSIYAANQQLYQSANYYRGTEDLYGTPTDTLSGGGSRQSTDVGGVSYGGQFYSNAAWVGDKLVRNGQTILIKGNARGGPLTGVNLVGEAGPEYIIGNQVIPAKQTRQMMNAGVRPGKRFGLGGAIDVDVPGDLFSDALTYGAAASLYISGQNSSSADISALGGSSVGGIRPGALHHSGGASAATIAQTAAQSAAAAVGIAMSSQLTAQLGLDSKIDQGIQLQILDELRRIPKNADMAQIMKSAFEQVVL